MSSVAVITDSACDLSDELAVANNVGIVPLTIRFGDTELVDRRDLTTQEFWDRSATSPVLPQTAAPAPGEFEAAFDRAADAGAEGVACIVLSSRLSATMQSASTAAGAFRRIPVTVIDSRSVTMGLGLIVLGAARLAAEGAGLEDVTAHAEEMAGRTRVYGALDTLENLKKGGRIGGAAALLGSMLSVKPILEVRDGAVAAESRQRTRARALRYLADKVLTPTDIEHLAVVHARAADLDQFLDLLDPSPLRQNLMLGDIGPVIGTHAGPGTIAVAFQVRP